MASGIGRRGFLKSGAGLAAGAALLPLMQAARAQGAALRATHFGGPYKALEEILGASFTAATKTEVAWGVETSVTALTKMQTAPDSPPFDVTLLSRSFALRALRANLLQPVDGKKLANLAACIPGTLGPSDCGAAICFDSVDIAVNTDVYSGKIGSWMDLWNPDLKGKLIMPSSAVSTALYVLISVVRAMGGKEENAKDVDAAFKKLAELKPNVRTFYGDPLQPTQILERGEAGVAPQFGIRIANQSRENRKIVRMSPKEGQVAIGYDFSITKAVKDAAVAHRFIDAALGADQQAKLAAALLAIPARKGVTVPDSMKPFAFTDSSKLLFIDEDFVAGQQKGWLQRWSREVQS